jgi:hypothetical protein
MREVAIVKRASRVGIVEDETSSFVGERATSQAQEKTLDDAMKAIIPSYTLPSRDNVPCHIEEVEEEV